MANAFMKREEKKKSVLSKIEGMKDLLEDNSDFEKEQKKDIQKSIPKEEPIINNQVSAALESSNTHDIFNLGKKAIKVEMLERNYLIKNRTVEALTKIAKIKKVSRNELVIELIKIGIEEELENISLDMNLSYFSSKIKKRKFNIRIPASYDEKLEKHKIKLEKESPEEIDLSKSEVLDIMFDLLLKRFD